MTPLERATAWADRLSLRGMLADARVVKVERAGGACHLHVHWTTEDSEKPGNPWWRPVVVLLRDDEGEDVWNRHLVEQVADIVGHELGEAIQLDGRPIADPHARPLVWPWRARDREYP